MDKTRSGSPQLACHGGWPVFLPSCCGHKGENIWIAGREHRRLLYYKVIIYQSYPQPTELSSVLDPAIRVRLKLWDPLPNPTKLLLLPCLHLLYVLLLLASASSGTRGPRTHGPLSYRVGRRCEKLSYENSIPPQRKNDKKPWFHDDATCGRVKSDIESVLLSM